MEKLLELIQDKILNERDITIDLSDIGNVNLIKNSTIHHIVNEMYVISVNTIKHRCGGDYNNDITYILTYNVRNNCLKLGDYDKIEYKD